MLADNPRHWRNRAAALRGLAVKMAGSHAAILMNDLAIDYEKQAEKAAANASGKTPLSNSKPG
jgi:hypothetical protein